MANDIKLGSTVKHTYNLEEHEFTVVGITYTNPLKLDLKAANGLKLFYVPIHSVTLTE